MLNQEPRRPGFRRRGVALCSVVALAATLTLSACGSSSSSSSSTSSAASTTASSSSTTTAGSSSGVLPVSALSASAMKQTIFEAFGANIPASTLDPVTTNALYVAGTPLSAANEALAAKCIKETTCETGHGTISVGLFDAGGTLNPYKVQARSAQTAQALTYPQVKSITFANGQNNVASSISAMKSLISQHVDVIVASMDFGNALLPVTKQAAKAGIIVVPYSNVIPAATGNGDIGADVTANLCNYGKTLGTLAAAGHTSGHVAVYTGTPGNPFGGTWSPCAIQTIKSKGLTATLGNTNWTPQGEAQAAAALAANPGDTVSTVYDYLPDGFFQKWLSLGKQPPTQVGGSAAYSTVKLYQQLAAKYPSFKFWVSESQLVFPRIATTAAIEKKLGGTVPLHIVPPQTVVTMANYLPYYKANPDLPAAAQFSTFLSPALMKTTLGS